MIIITTNFSEFDLIPFFYLLKGISLHPIHHLRQGHSSVLCRENQWYTSTVTSWLLWIYSPTTDYNATSGEEYMTLRD